MTLDAIAIKHGCDKSSKHHGYCSIYEKYISPLRYRNCNILELGYGGYDDPKAGGESARMWREYFSKAELTVVDIHWKDNTPDGVTFVCASQDNPMLGQMAKQDVVIDDASHINSLTIASFKLLWSVLAKGGLYIIEDLHSSYVYPYYPDANHNPEKGKTAMNFLKRLTDELNVDNLQEQFHLGYEIEFIHFYKDLAIIKKK